jgi:site-specific recombinase XerC
MLLLLRLGLRAGDIARMRPADIDWQEATLLVRGKGRRDVRLPLPQDAGDAVLEYLEHERPRVAIDRIFLCANAPFRALRSGGAVSDIVRGALRAAGVEDVPLHDSANHSLQQYLAARCRFAPTASTLFVSRNGAKLTYPTVITTFLILACTRRSQNRPVNAA